MNRRIESILETVLPGVKSGKWIPGTPVTVTFGPFRALRAVVVTTSRKRVVVRCSVEDRSFLIELDDSMIDETMLHRDSATSSVSDSFSECAP